MRFVTRERIHVDRIATAWAIRRFVDADAIFEFVPRTRDVGGIDAVPFDIRGAELGHRGGRCTLEALIDKRTERPGLEDDGADHPGGRPARSRTRPRDRGQCSGDF